MANNYSNPKSNSGDETIKKPIELQQKNINKLDHYGLKTVLQLKEFRKLWIGQVFSQLADKFYIVLMVYLIDQYWVVNNPQSNSALAEMASVIPVDIETGAQVITPLVTGIYIVNTLPAIFLGTVAGVWADRWPKKRVMVSSNALRAILVLFTPFCLEPGPSLIGMSWGYWALLIMTFLESILTQFFLPAEQATIPMLVPRKQLLAANSAYQATSMGATIIGFAFGIPMILVLKNSVQFFGFSGGEFLLLPLCYGVAAITLSTIQINETAYPRTENTVWDDIQEGIKVLKEKSTVRSAMVHLVLLYSLLAALYVLSISLASYIPSLGRTRFGILLATSGLGMSFGAVVIAQIGQRFSRRKLTATGLGTITWSLILLAEVRGSLSFTLLLCIALGIGSALVAIPAQTTLQEDTPQDKRGKVFGLQNNLINLSLSLPLVLSAGIVSQYGLVPVIWILAIIALIAAFLERPWKRC